MIQFSNKRQFNCPIEGNSIVQLKRKTFTQYGNTKGTSHQTKKTTRSTVGTTLPVISNVLGEEGACLSVNSTAAAHKKKSSVRL